MRQRTQRAGLIALAAGVAAFALIASQKQHAPPPRRPKGPLRDYSNRSGFPHGLEASRGLAVNAPVPADILTPAALRPLV